MKSKYLKQIFMYTAFALIAILNISIVSYAAQLPCESATVSGHYRHPVTNKIEDSGGESSEALGQSMVGNVVDSTALIEQTPNNDYLLSLRFKMMDSISDIILSTQKYGDSQWQDAAFETTDSTSDTVDLKISIEDKSTIIRAECFVEPMGRSVVFFITLDNFVNGNTANFLQTDESEVPSVSNTNTSNNSYNNVDGLVTGGQKNAYTANTNDKSTSGEISNIKELKIGTDVWIMLFVLTFCAQLLACLVFSIVKSLIFKSNTHTVKQVYTKRNDDEDEIDFSKELLDDDWETKNDEV